MSQSLSERLTEEPPPWLSPLRTAWAAVWTPWVMVCERFMRFAQAGGPSVAEAVRMRQARRLRLGVTAGDGTARASKAARLPA